MAFDWSSINSYASIVFTWLSSLFFWFIVAIIIIGATWGFLIIRKKRKLSYPCHIDTDLGAGKIGRETTKAGWFRTKTALFGLFDYGGEDILKTKDNRIVQNASSEDFQEIDGKRGLCCIRKGDDPAILLPVNRAGTSNKYGVGKKGELIPIKSMKVTNAFLLEEIAPADYRDASVKIIKDSAEETRGKYDKLINAIVYGTLGIIFLICIIMIVQMVKTSQSSAQEFNLESMREAQQYFNKGALPSNAP
jgi:hypothetical protein